MPGHGANSIFFDKKMKIGRPEHSLTPLPPTPLKVDVICVSPLKYNTECRSSPPEVF